MALTAANEAKWAADDVLAAAGVDLLAAQTELSDLNAELALLDASYNDPVTGAIAVFAAAQTTYDAGLPAAEAAVTAAEVALAAGEAAVVAAQIDYNAKLAAFEANPTGFVWTAGVNGALGLHADATTVTASYYVVNITDNGVGALTLSAGAGIDKTGAYGTYAAFLADATAGALAPGDYYDVGTDDVAGGTNADRLNAAVAILTAAQDAIAGLEADVTAAELALASFEQIYLDAKAAFEAQRDLYNNQVTLVADAQAVVDAAQLVFDDATDAQAAAVLVVTDASNAQIAADADLTTAEADLAAFEATTLEDIQGWIDAANLDIANWTAEIAAIQPIIDAKQAVVDALEVEAQSYIANEGVISGLYADLHAQIIAEWQVYWVMEQELTALQNSHDLNADLISAYGWTTDDLADLAGYLTNLQSQLADADYDIEVAEQALADAQVEEAAADAYIAYYQALVDTLEQRHANTLAIAAKYKALMDAALAS